MSDRDARTDVESAGRELVAAAEAVEATFEAWRRAVDKRDRIVVDLIRAGVRRVDIAAMTGTGRGALTAAHVSLIGRRKKRPE